MDGAHYAVDHSGMGEVYGLAVTESKAPDYLSMYQ